MDDWQFKPAGDMGLAGMARYRSYQRESGLATSCTRLAWWCAFRVVFRTWNRLRIHAQENLPDHPPFILAANHASHLDALLLMSALPLGWRDSVFPVAAKDVFFENQGVAAFGAIFVNALPVWRKRTRTHDMHDLRRRLVEPPAVFILFPEGTRTRDGELLPFKPGLGRLLAGSHVPVVPCYIEGSRAAMPPGCWLPRPRAIRIFVGKPRSFEDVPDNRQGWDHIASSTRQAVVDLSALSRGGTG